MGDPACPRGLRSFVFILATLPLVVVADDGEPDDNAYSVDPLDYYRPDFSRSLPVQIVLNSIILALLAVLLIQLLFTAQYHWRLARTNFVLQLAAVLTLLGSSIASIVVILQSCVERSGTWPYMLDYLAVDLPPLTHASRGTWSPLSLTSWQLMTTVWSALIQVTHIQFLTLMYPSRLEASLIFILLGPLAIIAAAMNIALPRTAGSATDVIDAVRNVCNASLSLLFTIALFLWGFVVNRTQAWRTDGGTAAFGAAALFLAIVSCALTFLYIPSAEQYDWMPPLAGVVMLWQSFLGWWWWVGAGMAIGEVEDFLRREEKRARKRTLREERRREQKERARELWSGVTSKLGARRRSAKQDQTVDGDVEEIDVDAEGEHTDTAPTSPGSSAPPSVVGGPTPASSWSPTRMWTASRSVFVSALAYLRTTHMLAAQARVRSQADRYASAYGAEGARGWGLGSFGVREARRRGGEAEERSEEENEEERVKELERGAGSGMWWWGPLRRWRLQDSTTYS